MADLAARAIQEIDETFDDELEDADHLAKVMQIVMAYKAAARAPLPEVEANARAIYEAYGFAYESRTVNAKGEPYGEWAKAVNAARAVSEQSILAPDGGAE